MQAQDVIKYTKIIRKWWWVIVLLFVATVGTMLAVSYLSEPKYEAVVTVQVSAPPPEESPLYSDEFGREVVGTVIAQTMADFSQLLQEGDIVYRTLEAMPEISIQPEVLRDKQLLVEEIENTQLLRIKVQATDPKTAEVLANALVAKALERYGELRAQSTVNTRMFIETELESARSELDTAESEFVQFQIANKIGKVDSAIDRQGSLIRDLKMQSDLALADGDTAKAKALDRSIEQREVELQNLLGLVDKFVDLDDNLERARSTYNFLISRLHEAQIKENQILQVGFIQIITPAYRPKAPVSLITTELIVMAAVASILAGILLTFLLEYMSLSKTPQNLSPLPERQDVTRLSDAVG